MAGERLTCFHCGMSPCQSSSEFAVLLHIQHDQMLLDRTRTDTKVRVRRQIFQNVRSNENKPSGTKIPLEGLRIRPLTYRSP